VTGLADLADIGRDARRGGYSRHGFDRADASLREWFTEQASLRGLDVHTDRNGNLWAWWGRPGPDAVLTGSHLDSVPGGGAFDGPLGVVSALDAVLSCSARGFSRVGHWRSWCSVRRRAVGSGCRASGRG